ncbi:MAG: uracil-DNA glycosylase [Candidatus Xenobia bacterium]
MKDFDALQQDIVSCRHCPRLVEWREQVARERTRRFSDQTYWGRPVPTLGYPSARLLIVGLAPAAHGGNRTGRMFTGDRSGDWLFEALHRYGFCNQAESVSREDGLQLIDCMISASVRCAPPDNKPTPQEFEACRPYLVAEAAMMQNLRVVVALGQAALATAWHVLGSGPRPPFGHGYCTPLPGGRHLICSFHPSQQNTFTGRLTRPMFHAVFETARTLLHGRP